ncbi:zinc finger domain-containing protein [Micromonospora sp. CB01531]|uniref:zinc finger domain-containing protein n=1 Tax=Micromonospora sp. CB01531 TaxID=1718947 RepID=UPI003FD2DFC3
MSFYEASLEEGERLLLQREAWRDRVRNSVSCPKCRVAIGQPCLGKNGSPRRSCHQERNRLCR